MSTPAKSIEQRRRQNAEAQRRHRARKRASQADIAAAAGETDLAIPTPATPNPVYAQQTSQSDSLHHSLELTTQSTTHQQREILPLPTQYATPQEWHNTPTHNQNSPHQLRHNVPPPTRNTTHQTTQNVPPPESFNALDSVQSAQPMTSSKGAPFASVPLPSATSMVSLVDAIETTPIIDHHAHNLLIPTEIGAHHLLSITSEANGAALNQGAPSTLAHLRAVRQLAKVLGCDASWAAVQRAIEQKRQEPDDAWARRCFHGIETALIDDGLDPSNVHPYSWHDRLTRSKCKRIVRIERVAEIIMTNAFDEFSKMVSFDQHSAFAHHVVRRFASAIRQNISDPEVAGFKSVICYRTGLAIPKSPEDCQSVLSSLFQTKQVNKFFRLEDERLGPCFVHITAQELDVSGSKKPFQFHTGLGDNDIYLELSNPSHLQEFIKTYPEVPIVLLHASYPFTTEAGYLASVYSNVWLDIGEVFPFVSHDGQERVIRDALDLCPSEKLMWSTGRVTNLFEDLGQLTDLLDGHWFPETYLLAIIQVREGIHTVLCEYVDRGALTFTEATRIVQDIFFNTSNRLYGLRLTLKPIEPAYSQDILTVGSDKHWSANLVQLKLFLARERSIRYLRLQWLDYTATLRVRVVPIKQALQMFSNKKFVTVVQAALGLLQNDFRCPGFPARLSYNLYPIFQSLRLGSRKGYATLQCEFREEDGQEVLICPRTVLRKQVDWASAHGMNLLIGFEIEVVFTSPKVVNGAFRYGETPVNDGGHAWSTARALHRDDIMDILETIHTKFEAAGIDLQQMHTESCPGQYEFVLGPLPPLEAVDTLLSAREIISSITANASLRATLHPKPVPAAAGTGAHFHISVTPVDNWGSFYAGILKHMRAIAAFTYSNDASYERVVDGAWAGSTWIAWGTQNRETPLRRVEGSHFEVKCIDGFSNPYLALTAVVGAGVQGVLSEEALVMKDCAADPSTLSAEERERVGITQQFPPSIDEALFFLEQDEELRKIVGKPVVDTYIHIKRTENEMLKRMDAETRRDWLIERY